MFSWKHSKWKVNGKTSEMKAKTGYTISMNSQILNNIDQFIISKKRKDALWDSFPTRRKILSDNSSSYPHPRSATISNLFSEECRWDWNLALTLWKIDSNFKYLQANTGLISFYIFFQQLISDFEKWTDESMLVFLKVEPTNDWISSNSFILYK